MSYMDVAEGLLGLIAAVGLWIGFGIMILAGLFFAALPALLALVALAYLVVGVDWCVRKAAKK